MHKHLKILLAEDDTDDADTFYEATVAHCKSVDLKRFEDGKLLLDYLSCHTIENEIIFLDLNMPRKNGFQCLSEIRSNVDFKCLPVIIFSTTSAEEIIWETYNKGASCFIQKPADFALWEKSIEYVLDIDWKNRQTSRDNFIISIKK